jgi:D-xylose transport system substrate-binding protein
MKKYGVLAACVLAAALLAACGSNSSSTSSSTTTSSTANSKNAKIAFLLPENQTARYETQDRPLFEADVKNLCPGCQVLYSNALQDSSKQQSDAEAAMAQGAKVLVLDAVDGAAAAAIVNEANAKGIPVISYDRLLLNSKPAYYVEFDSTQVGKVQATYLDKRLAALGHKSGNVVMINGAPTDNNAKLFKQGALSVLDKSGFKIAKQYDTPDWSPSSAQTEMDQAIAALGENGFIGVYAANDGTESGAVASMKAAGIDPTKIPSTGQDAEVTGIQRLLIGDQYVDVYKPIKPLAQTAAQWAVDLVQGKKPTDATSTENNGKINVPTKKLNVVPVTAKTVESTVIKDGFWKASQICTAAYKAACAKYGVK